MIPAYIFAAPYEANPSPVLIWNAYAPSFHPNAQIDFGMNPLFHDGFSIHDRAMFYWYGVYAGDVITPYVEDLISLHTK